MSNDPSPAPDAALDEAPAEAPVVPSSRKLPILALRGMIPLPGMPHPLAVTRSFSLAAVNEARDDDDEVLLLMQLEAADDDPGLEGFHRTGVTGRLSKSVRTSDGALRLVVQPMERARVLAITRDGEAYEATIETVAATETDENVEIDALMHTLRSQVRQLVEISPTGNAEVVSLAENIADPGLLADFVATQLQLRSNDIQLVLETFDVKERLAEVVRFAGHALDVAELGKKIQDEVQGQLEEARRQAYLREQMKAIRKEMGDEDDPDVARIRKLIATGVLGKEAQDVAESELRRLETIPSASPERGWVVNYLDWLVSLPWTEMRPERQDLAEASAILDREHYGMEKAKERILETLAVRQRNPDGKAPILCFVGPPGTGKTSLAQAVAEATGPRARTHQRRRRVRRERDPRAPPHLRRRHARPHHQRAAQGRFAQPRLRRGRDRQDVRLVPRRPGRRPPRGPRPRAERQLRGPVHRGALRPELARALHHHRQHADARSRVRCWIASR